MENIEKKKFYCESCKYGCDNNSTYKKHISSQVHARGGQKKIYKCGSCEYMSTISAWNYKMHFLAMHATKEERAKQKYYCSVCDAVFFSPLYQNNHNKSVSHLTNVAKKQLSEQTKPETQQNIIPTGVIDNKMVEIANNQLKVDSEKLEIYIMIDKLSNKLKDKTKRDFHVDDVKKLINTMMTLLN
jgi:hypothetical protein